MFQGHSESLSLCRSSIIFLDKSDLVGLFLGCCRGRCCQTHKLVFINFKVISLLHAMNTLKFTFFWNTKVFSGSFTLEFFNQSPTTQENRVTLLTFSKIYIAVLSIAPRILLESTCWFYDMKQNTKTFDFVRLWHAIEEAHVYTYEIRVRWWWWWWWWIYCVQVYSEEWIKKSLAFAVYRILLYFIEN